MPEMYARHEPRDEFVERLEWQVSREMRRRNGPGGVTRWPRLKTVLAMVGLMIVSMSAGAAVVAAGYHAQDAERRTLLTSAFEKRLALAQQRVQLATEELQAAE